MHPWVTGCDLTIESVKTEVTSTMDYKDFTVQFAAHSQRVTLFNSCKLDGIDLVVIKMNETMN